MDMLDPICEGPQCHSQGLNLMKTQETRQISSRNTSSRIDWYNREINVFDSEDDEAQRFAKVEGSLLQVSPLFACILVGDIQVKPIPQQLKVSLNFYVRLNFMLFE